MNTVNPSELSKKEQLALLSCDDQQMFLDSLSEEEAEHLLYDWEFNGRPKQLEGFPHTELYQPGSFRHTNDWDFWLILAGRGFGKTRTGAEWVRYQVEVLGRKRIGILGPTSADLRDVIVEGDSGILAVSHPSNRPIFEPTKRRVTWSNGAIATLYSAEEPERLRGPQHDAIWMDEIAGWANGNPEVVQRAWDMAMFGLRLGTHPQVCITTTPKPIPLVQTFVKWSKDPKRKMLLTSGSTYDNKSNLAPSFYNQIAMYEGTTLGRQEIHAEVINLEEQGILKRSWFKLWYNRDELPSFSYIIQSYDTAFTEKTHNDPTACTVWGVFLNDDGNYCVMLLDAWTDHLQYPDLRERVIDEYKATYGGEEGNPLKPGHRPDIVLVEEKGSGITLCQDLQRAGVPARPFNPGRADKVQRMHSISHLVAAGRVFIPESAKVPGEFRTWATDFISEVCIFPLSLHDDFCDTLSQALMLLRDQTWLSIDPSEEEEDYDYHEERKSKENPYAV